MSRFNNDDWFEPIEEKTPDNVIVEVLEEDDDFDAYNGIGFDSDRFDSEFFSIGEW